MAIIVLRRIIHAPTVTWGVAIGALVVSVAAGFGVFVWLVGQAGVAVDPASIRMNAVKTGLAAGAGMGGVFALLLVVRRQSHHEEDANERRTIELYSQAVEQLGSEKAPVRLGALYALERLAQHSVDQRSAVMNVLCAYLRMPYFAAGHDDCETVAGSIWQGNYREELQEREVRLVAQRMVVYHLQPGQSRRRPSRTYWSNIDEIDLTGARLIDFNFDGCMVNWAVFDKARFVGEASFEELSACGLSFRQSVFLESASFTSMVVQVLDLTNASFIGQANFNRALIKNYAYFEDVSFGGRSDFSGIKLVGTLATFSDVKFHGKVLFLDVLIKRILTFVDAKFYSDVVFDDKINIGMYSSEIRQGGKNQMIRLPGGWKVSFRAKVNNDDWADIIPSEDEV